MSNIISLGLLTQRREDAKKMEARAKELLQELNANSEFRIDWVGRIYTVLNPMVQKMEDPTIGSGVAIYEFTENGDLSNRMWVEKWVMDHLMAAQRFIQANNLFDLLTYNITRLDENENYLFVLEPLYFKDIKKWTKRFLLELLGIIIAIIILCIVL